MTQTRLFARPQWWCQVEEKRLLFRTTSQCRMVAAGKIPSTQNGKPNIALVYCSSHDKNMVCSCYITKIFKGRPEASPRRMISTRRHYIDSPPAREYNAKILIHPHGPPRLFVSVWLPSPWSVRRRSDRTPRRDTSLLARYYNNNTLHALPFITATFCFPVDSLSHLPPFEPLLPRNRVHSRPDIVVEQQQALST